MAMWWKIIGLGELPDLRIYAESFDEALRKARLRDPRYCGGYVDDETDRR